MVINYILIGSGNGMDNVLISMCMCSIPTKDKNSTSKGGGEDREVTVSGPPMLMGVWAVNSA
jgi:hypothetical protein